ncbi:hypothetical protein C1645_781673 [Glomus cerebriforme]|uniref:Uncharacterized protein n=1 Tax=Glomus cerebriforme TaxID=658196 RepID=A0A397SS93_9GLOM|nr:hypothetical protein C1645_781673 [Glomus cerebriforme]
MELIKLMRLCVNKLEKSSNKYIFAHDKHRTTHDKQTQRNEDKPRILNVATAEVLIDRLLLLSNKFIIFIIQVI